MRLALVAMPWPLFNRPSVQLGVLKGYLHRAWPELQVQNFHPYLRVALALGYELYHELSETQWLAEALSAALLFPEKSPSIKEFVLKQGRKRGLKFDFEKTVAAIEKTLTTYLSRISWSEFRAVGFSVCLNQLMSSLWAAAWLKKKYPDLPIIFGGSGCAAEMGKSLLKTFPFIDFIINGEGERPLYELLKFLAGQGPFPEKGLFYRQGEQVLGGGHAQLPGEALPSPIYEDYLREVAGLPPERRFFPLIPLEASRGCWWLKCRFCNLNLQWEGYRRKPLAQVINEVRAHARAGLLDFAFMDNCLPIKDALSLFKTLAEDQIDYRFFAELRAVYRREDYALMRRGGLTWVQIGIEALSTSLLRRINKGTTAIDNIAAMRHCEEQGLILEANLIMHFPGSTEKEVEETLKTLDYVFPFRPLSPVSFWLGYGSPVFREPKKFGLKAVYPHPFYRYFLPEEVFKSLVPLAWNYRGDRGYQQKIWKPVEAKVRRWQKAYQRLKKEKGPLLSYRDGGQFLLIRQVLPGGQVLHHRLPKASREIYLFITDPKSLEEISARFPRLPRDKIESFLNDLVAKRLVFREGERFLALAIRKRNET